MTTKRKARQKGKGLAAPEEIWLQWNGDQDPDDDAEKHEVTWCQEKVYAHDVRYVRALSTPARSTKQG